MTRPIEHDPESGLMRMLREALRAGLAPGADDEAFVMARASAQIIGLNALDEAIGALDPFRGRPWQGPALEMVEFVERLLAEGDLTAFRAAEADFAMRAEALGHWRAPLLPEDVSPAAPPHPEDGTGGASGEIEEDVPAALPPEGSVLVEDALAELPLSGDAATSRAAHAWLAAPVAAGLRAALEWLVGDPEHPRPFRLRAEESVLEVTCEGVRPEGLAAAHELLAEAGGNLAPLGEVSARAIAGAWMVRVPTWSPRPVHLMLEQGDLRLALPWHSVLRLSLVPTIEIEMREGTLNTRVLPPLAPLHDSTGERPVVAIAHGLKRGLLVADRLVWRLGAEPCEPDGPPPAPGLRETVRSVEGEAYWVADPARLLADLPVPTLPGERGPREPGSPPRGTPPIEPRRAPEAIEPAVLEAADVEPIELSALEVEPLPLAGAPAASPVADTPVAPRVEEPPAATPVEGPAPAAEPPDAAEPADLPATAAADAAPEPGSLSAPATEPPLPGWIERFGAPGGPGVEAPEAAAAGTRTENPDVLIVEDSIVARHFLTRLFERRGLSVVAVDTAAEARTSVGLRQWCLVCVDVDLPDAIPGAFVAELRESLEPLGVPLVALVRDDDDTERAEGAGVRRWLRKPFDFDSVDHLLSRLGLLAEPR